MPTVSAQQVEIDQLTSRINLADDRLQAFRAYLSTLKGPVSIDDVERHLGEIWRELHGIN